jgi:hypothetical protein
MSTETTAHSGDAAVRPSAPKHPKLLHWLPWLLPNGAIGLAVIVLLFTQVSKNRWDLIAQSVHRGDFLIPIIIICADAFLRWRGTEFGDSLNAFLAPFFGCFSGALVIIVPLAYGFIADSSPPNGYGGTADFANIITWLSFGVGFLAGTLSLWETRPRGGAIA